MGPCGHTFEEKFQPRIINLPQTQLRMKAWWLILCLYLTGLRGVLVKHYIWVSLWGCFWEQVRGCIPEEISIWIGRLSKEDCPCPCRWASSDTWRAWTWQKGRGRVNLLFAWAGTSTSFCLHTSALLVLRTLDLNFSLHHQLSWFSKLYMTVGLSASGIT